MAVEVNSVAIRYRYGEADDISVDIRYRYDENVPATSTMDCVYRYSKDTDTERHERQLGFWAWSTQDIANRFPRWTMPRLNVRGTTQQLINTWGMSMDHTVQNYLALKRDSYIGTADITQPGVFYHGSTVDYGTRLKSRATNLLQNPSFTIKGLARQTVPLWWSKDSGETTGSAVMVESPTFVGTHSIRLDAEQDERVYLSQRHLLDAPEGESLTASLWYMVPLANDALESDTAKAALCLYVQYVDGMMDVVRVPLDLGTNGEWRRKSVTIELEKELFHFNYMVDINNSEATPIRVYCGAAQAELGTHASTWEEPGRTIFPYINDVGGYDSPVDAYIDLGVEETTEELVEGEPVTYDARTLRKLTYVPRDDTFWYGLHPTRVNTSLLTTVPSAVQNTTLGWFSSPDGDRFPTNWRVEDNYIEQYNQRITHEVVGKFSLAETNLDERVDSLVGVMSDTEDPGFTRTIETLCVHRGYLWVVCKEVEDGVTTRSLKKVNPHSHWPVPEGYTQDLEMFLEVMGDVDLELNTGTADYIGVIEEGSDKLLLRVSDSYYVVTLEYDYFTFDADRRQVILRTEYPDGELITV